MVERFTYLVPVPLVWVVMEIFLLGGNKNIETRETISQSMSRNGRHRESLQLEEDSSLTGLDWTKQKRDSCV